MDKPSSFEAHYFSESKAKWIPVSEMPDEYIRKAFKKVLNSEWYQQHAQDDTEYKNDRMERIKSDLDRLDKFSKLVRENITEIETVTDDIRMKTDGY
jgi:predicted lipid carrier protein YhbT